MELLLSTSLWRGIPVAVALAVATRIFYRFYLHPLAKFPGPKLAAATRLYEAYYDLVRNGQYGFKIAQLHDQYGPIIRISPYELHVRDPAFFEKLYRQDGRWEKYAWSYDAFGAPGATICTAPHDLHRHRRAPLNPFFSKAKVASRQALLRRLTRRLCARIDDFAADDRGRTGTFRLGDALSALTRDVATEFVLGKNYHSLDAPAFNVAMTTVIQDSGHLWRVTKHLPWFGPTLRRLPLSWVEKLGDEGAKTFYVYLNDTVRETQSIMAEVAASPDANDTRTIVHAILDAPIPPEEKTMERVFYDVSTVTAAAFETTAATLRAIVYHVFTDPRILHTLREELDAAQDAAVKTSKNPLEDDDDGNDGLSSSLSLSALEQLPYLTAVLSEGLRISPAIASRMARIAPDRDLFYDKWRIPAGTPVGMTTLMMHMDEKLYPNPKQFAPERWADVETRSKSDGTFAPFSRGTRSCLGMHLAWAELYIIISTLVQRFDFEFVGVGPESFECVSDQFIIGTRKQDGMQVRVSRRV